MGQQTAVEKMANDFISLIEMGNPSRFTAYCSSHGVVFGVDPPPISVSRIQQDIDERRGIYCGLFNTECLRKEDAQDRARAGAPPSRVQLFSYRERLSKMVNRQVIVSDSSRGTVSVAVTSPGRGLSQEPMEFYFRLENGTWKLSDIPFW
jgi:hypothetical protein